MKANFILITTAILITCIGLTCLYSSSYLSSPELSGIFQLVRVNINSVFGFQFIRFLVSIIALVILCNFSYRRLFDISYLFFIFMIIILILVLFLGHVSLGAQRWIRLGPINFQPAEFAKLTVSIYLADYLTRKRKKIHEGSLKIFFPPLGLIGMMCILILLQPDLGSTAFICIIVAATLIITISPRAGLIGLIVSFIIAAISLWFFCKKAYKEYHRKEA